MLNPRRGDRIKPPKYFKMNIYDKNYIYGIICELFPKLNTIVTDGWYVERKAEQVVGFSHVPNVVDMNVYCDYCEMLYQCGHCEPFAMTQEQKWLYRKCADILKRGKLLNI